MKPCISVPPLCRHASFSACLERRVCGGVWIVALSLGLGMRAMGQFNLLPISTHHEVSASWYEYDVWDSYTDSSDTRPVGTSVRTPEGWASTSAGVGVADTSSPDWGFWVHSSAWCGEEPGVSIGSAAEGVWEFRPTYRLLVVELEGTFQYNYASWEQSLEVHLKDLTDDRTLLRFDGRSFEFGEVPPRLEFEADPMHVYGLTLSASGGAWLSKDYTVSAQARVYTLPVPGLPDTASSAGLLGLAFGVVLVARRASSAGGGGLRSP